MKYKGILVNVYIRYDATDAKIRYVLLDWRKVRERKYITMETYVNDLHLDMHYTINFERICEDYWRNDANNDFSLCYKDPTTKQFEFITYTIKTQKFNTPTKPLRILSDTNNRVPDPLFMCSDTVYFSPQINRVCRIVKIVNYKVHIVKYDKELDTTMYGNDLKKTPIQNGFQYSGTFYWSAEYESIDDPIIIDIEDLFSKYIPINMYKPVYFTV
jgi:hypothetical protein